MTEITGFKPTKRGRVALFGDGEFLFSVDEETLAKSGLEKGSVLSGAEIEALRAQSDTRKAADAALRYLSLRAYGQRELYEKLLLRYDEHSAAAALAKMCELELMDDAGFALEKAKGMAQRGKSPLEIKRKLAALGIDGALADEAVNAAGIDSAALALQLIQKRYIDDLRAGKRDKVMAALARRGFSYSDISSALAAAGEGGDE